LLEKKISLNRQRQNDEQRFGPNILPAAAASDDTDINECIDVSGSGKHNTGGVVQKVEKDAERSSQVCAGHDKRDDRVVFTARLFTQQCT